MGATEENRAVAPRTPHTASSTAGAVRRCLAGAPPNDAEALRWVTELVTEFRRARRDPERLELVAEAPPTTGSRRWDALLAGVVEHLCYHGGLRVPAWTTGSDRFLDEWWFLAANPRLHASAFVDSPRALANRGVFLHAASLDSM